MVYYERVHSPMPLLQTLPSTAGGILAYRGQEDCVVNLAGAYRYLEAGYYTSQDLEAAGMSVRPRRFRNCPACDCGLLGCTMAVCGR
jgi:hypothetical protein